MYGVFCREQARAVARREDVAVLTWRLDSTLRSPFRVDSAQEDGLHTFRVRFARGRVPRSTFAFKLAGCLAAVARLRRGGWWPDVIHAHEYVAGPVALTVGALTRAPVVVSEHYSGFALGTLPAREQRRARWAFEHAGVVCPVSRNLAEHIGALAPAARLEPVPNVVDTDVFVRPHTWPSSATPRLVTVGSLVEIKGHRHLVEALGRLRRAGRDLTLDVIGDGPLRPQLEALARTSGVDDLIAFHGTKSKAEVAAALGRADAFVLPSLWENLPCAMLEAMATGLPVVATAVGGVPEIVGPPQGILVTPGSSEALADAISALVDRIGDYDRVGLRAKAVDGFGYEAIARRWASVYRSIDGIGERVPA